MERKGMEATNWEQKEFFSVKEAAEFLGLSVSTIRRYIYDHRLRAYKVAGERLIRIRREDLEALLEPMLGAGNHHSTPERTKL